MESSCQLLVVGLSASTELCRLGLPSDPLMKQDPFAMLVAILLVPPSLHQPGQPPLFCLYIRFPGVSATLGPIS